MSATAGIVLELDLAEQGPELRRGQERPMPFFAMHALWAIAVPAMIADAPDVPPNKGTVSPSAYPLSPPGGFVVAEVVMMFSPQAKQSIRVPWRENRRS